MSKPMTKEELDKHILENPDKYTCVWIPCKTTGIWINGTKIPSIYHSGNFLGWDITWVGENGTSLGLAINERPASSP